MSEYDNISALRIDLYDIDSPQEIVSKEKPANALRYAWIPQTVADEIWLLYEFETSEARLEWEQSLSPTMTNWLDRRLIPRAIGYGWHSRNMNGFIQGEGKVRYKPS